MIRNSIFDGVTWIMTSATGMILDSFTSEGEALKAQQRFKEIGIKTTIEKL